MNAILNKIKKAVYLLVLLLTQFMWTGCLFSADPPLDSYYTFTGETVADYLKNRDQFTEFVSILDRANLFDLLSTYGEYTCFAPTNAAIDSLLLEKGLSTIDELTTLDCDTIAKTHLIMGAFYTTSLEDGAIPATNFLNRYLMLTSDSVRDDNGQAIYPIQLRYLVNKVSEILLRDDSVENGVVHTIDRVISPSNQFLPQLLESDTTISIFTELMRLTGWDKKMQDYIDDSYTIGADSLDFKLTYTTGSTTRKADYPEYRRYYYTGFIEPDNVYIKSGVSSAEEVINKLLSKSGIFAMYDPYNRYTYNDDYTDTTNVVYRFVAYHFLNRLGNYADWTVGTAIRDAQARPEYLDPQEFYPTMCPNTIMKFQYNTSTSGGAVGLYINRRRVNEGANADREATNVYAAAVTGVRVWTPTEMSAVDQSALNGVYHYIDDVLILNSKAADALNTRIRMDGGTLSPDFMNDPCSDGLVGKNRTDSEDGLDQLATLYKPDFIENFTLSAQTKMGIRIDPLTYSPSYECSGIDFSGLFNFTIKLPPVPEGTYEIRLGVNFMTDRGIVQMSFGQKGALKAQGIPLDLRDRGVPRVGWVADVTEEEDADYEEINKRNDKDLHSRGFMKGPDSWFIGNGKTTSIRNYNGMRVIIATEYLTEGVDYYIGFKSIELIGVTEMMLPLDYIELCPKSVYGSPDGEDTH